MDLARCNKGDTLKTQAVTRTSWSWIFGKAFLDTFLNLTRVHGERAMHRYVSWYAVQDIAKYANLELAINHYGSEDLARRVHSIHCARLTEMLVGVSFALPQLRMSLPADAARTISSMAQIVALVTDDHLNFEAEWYAWISYGRAV
ncbi:hypothetical protein MRX96_047375 [Rhipicephalus microplus]